MRLILLHCTHCKLTWLLAGWHHLKCSLWFFLVRKRIHISNIKIYKSSVFYLSNYHYICRQLVNWSESTAASAFFFVRVESWSATAWGIKIFWTSVYIKFTVSSLIQFQVYSFKFTVSSLHQAFSIFYGKCINCFTISSGFLSRFQFNSCRWKLYFLDEFSDDWPKNQGVTGMSPKRVDPKIRSIWRPKSLFSSLLGEAPPHEWGRTSRYVGELHAGQRHSPHEG